MSDDTLQETLVLGNAPGSLGWTLPSLPLGNGHAEVTLIFPHPYAAPPAVSVPSSGWNTTNAMVPTIRRISTTSMTLTIVPLDGTQSMYVGNLAGAVITVTGTLA